ncbi:MAG: phosphoglycerate dehydrogenase [Verrucomicrobia bacterium]|nr:phosphoglycerate dehydrogenase [Verrucomicrobiota bacterium]
MSWKVLVTARTFKDVGGPAMEALKKAGCEVVIPPRFGPLADSELLPLLEGVDAVLCSPDAYSAAVLSSSRAARLKIVSRWGVGYDSIDVAAATRLGIAVAYVPGLLNETVADYTFALLLALARRVHEGHAWMAKGDWKLFWGSDVSGKTLGIIGCGRIGLAVARRAAGFNLRLLGHDVVPSAEPEKLGIKMVALDELLAESDFVTLHAALTPQSRGLIGEQQLRKMKSTAFLINAGRGALLDESALVRALQDGWIAGAALDTFTKEPLPSDHPLRYAPNVLLTPHLASFARENGMRVSLAAAQAIVDLMNGKQPHSLVNPEVLSSSALRARL